VNISPDKSVGGFGLRLTRDLQYVRGHRTNALGERVEILRTFPAGTRVILVSDEERRAYAATWRDVLTRRAIETGQWLIARFEGDDKVRMVEPAAVTWGRSPASGAASSPDPATAQVRGIRGSTTGDQNR